MTGIRPAAEQPARPTSRIFGAASTAVGFVILLWGIHLFNALSGYRLIAFGIRPRDVEGMWGILFAPFLHVDFTHLMANSGMAALLLFVLAPSGKRELWISSILIGLIAGFGVWLVGSPYSVHVGASGLIYGWLAYLITRGLFTRRFLQLLIGVVLALSYWGMVWGIMPGQEGISWEGHLMGAAGGVIAAGTGLASTKKKKQSGALTAPGRGHSGH